MTLEEMQEAKRATENAIAVAVQAFMDATDLKVEEVLVRVAVVGAIGMRPEPKVAEVSLDVRL